MDFLLSGNDEGPAGPRRGTSPSPNIFRWVSWRMAAMRRAVSAKCWTSSGLEGPAEDGALAVGEPLLEDLVAA